MKNKTKISVIFISILCLFTISNADTGFGISDVGTISSIFTSVINVPADQPSIQAGINAATNGDTVLVADSTYFENINFNGKAITVASWFLWDGDSTHIDNTIIDGSLPSNQDSGSVVSFVSGEDTNSVLYGFTITNGTGTISSISGSVERYGGGIFCDNSGASIKSNKIINNSISHNKGNGCGIGVAATSIVHVNILGNHIRDNTINGISGAFGGGLLFANASGKIIGNVVNNNSCTCSDSTAYGGGINLWSDLTQVPYVILKDNQVNYNSASGVGMYPYFGAVGCGLLISGTNALVLYNKITNNESINTFRTLGVGLCLNFVTDITVVDSNLISQNTASNASAGGGVGVLYCTEPVIINNTIENNSAYLGGGIWTRYSDPDIEKNMIITNYASTAGGIYSLDSNPNIVNNLIKSNNVINRGGFKWGGGIFSANSNMKVINNTIINNIAGDGGGIHSYDATDTVVVLNSIIWGNQAPNYPAISLNSGSMDVVYSDVQGGWSGEGNIDSDPLFSDTLFNLSQSSPCVGTGIDSIPINGTWHYCPATDFAGNPRPNSVDDLVDMGALESAFPNGIIKEDSDYLPKVYSLNQNYPNPFNPITTIEFAIPKAELVTLKIYNLLGQEVATLVSDKFTPGSYKYEWNASGFASGLYYYKIEAGDYIKTKKFILLK